MGGISLIVVERTDGLTTRKMDCQGVLASGTTYVTYEDVRVPVGNMLGKENKGFQVRSPLLPFRSRCPDASFVFHSDHHGKLRWGARRDCCASKPLCARLSGGVAQYVASLRSLRRLRSCGAPSGTRLRFRFFPD